MNPEKEVGQGVLNARYFVRWVLRDGGWVARLKQRGSPEEMTVQVAVGAAEEAKASWNPMGGLPLETYVRNGVEMALLKLERSMSTPRGRSVEAREFRGEEAETITNGVDTTFEEAARRDEVGVLREWCLRQGPVGAMLFRRLSACTAEELAAEFGMSVSQARRKLARITGVATQRFSG